MTRREFITLLGGAAAAWPLAARAQQTERVRRIGQVRAGSPELNFHSATAFEHRLKELGYVPSSTIELLNRFVPPQPLAMEDAIHELLPRPSICWSSGTLLAVLPQESSFVRSPSYLCRSPLRSRWGWSTALLLLEEI